jgi:predicted Zn-dependent protease
VVDRDWQEQVADEWRARHHRAASVQRRADELAQTDLRHEAVATLWERACATLDLHGPDTAEPLLRELLSQRPAHAPANLALGRHLLSRGQSEGESLLRRILDQPESELVPEACQVLAQHYQSSGQADELRQVHARQGRFQQTQADAIRERISVTAQDHLVPHGLSDLELASLCATLAADSELAEAYLVQKELKNWTHQPLYVLCVRTRPSFFGRSKAAQDMALVQRLIPQVRLAGRVLVISPQGGFRSLARKIMTSPEANIHRASCR